MTYLTVPISAENLENATTQINSAKKYCADLLELRTDYLKNLTTDLAGQLIDIAKKSKLKLLVTCRDQKQGGQNNYPQQTRTDILTLAVKRDVDFVDCEYENFKNKNYTENFQNQLNQNPNTKLILSAHNFNSKFNDIKDLHARIKTAWPNAIPKIAYKAQHINDCFDAFDILHENKGSIVICMGESGNITRIIAKKLNALLTFASLNPNSATAPGQLTIQQMKKLYRFDKINAQTALFGIIADPVGHSISPAVHNACFEAEKLNNIYLPILVTEAKTGFDNFMQNILDRPWLDFKGFSVTIPHKTNALEYVRKKGDYIEPLAAKIGAVNTIAIGLNKRLSAYNTDYAGALDALTSAMKIKRKQLQHQKCAILGAGGVARAIVAALTDLGAKVTIYNRTESKAKSLATEFNCLYAPIADLKKTDAAIVINCTSIGMHPNTEAAPFPKEALKPEMTVFDTVYNPAETRLLKQAGQAGANTITGLEMFIGQAIEQYRHFTNTHCPEPQMRKAVKDAMKT